MAVQSLVPTKLKLAQVTSGPIQFATDTLFAMLVTAGAGIPNTTSGGIAFVSDITATNPEVTGTGYARQTLTSVTVAFDGSVNTQVDFSHAAITFTQNAAGFTNGRYLVLAKNNGTDATDQVFLIFDPNVTVSAQTGSVVFTSPTGGELQWQ